MGVVSPLIVFIGCLLAAAPDATNEAPPAMYPQLTAYIEQRIAEFDRIPVSRRERLEEIVRYVSECRAAGKPARLVFVCTHNSRRSHFSQLWAQAAAIHYGVPSVFSYSGGTEATAFNPRAVAAVERAGFRVESGGDDVNPVYFVRLGDAIRPLACFSKPYTHAPNPRQDFCAVMVCSDADEKCPTVAGAAARVALPFDDPKAFDGTAQEAAKYDERCRDVAREMLWVFSRVARSAQTESSSS